MTSRERFIASLQCRPVDRFFRFEHGPWPTTRERWIKEGYPADADFLSYFQFDPLVSIGINSGYTNSPYHPKFKQETTEEKQTELMKIYMELKKAEGEFAKPLGIVVSG